MYNQKPNNETNQNTICLVILYDNPCCVHDKPLFILFFVARTNTTFISVRCHHLMPIRMLKEKIFVYV